MRSILLHIHEDDCLEARFQAALDLARQFDGHITCLQAIPYEFGVPGDFYGTAAAQMAMELRKEARRLRDTYEARLGKEDVRWEWYDSDGSAARLIRQHAPLSDLTILGSRNPVGAADNPSRLVTDLVGELRAPMMVVPAGMKAFSAEAPAMIAWNGSTESAHALCGAMPMLRRAKQVHILIVQEAKDEQRSAFPSLAAAEYLSRYDIEAEIIEIPHDRDDKVSIANKLLNASEMRGGGYLVMGGYGHSRIRERVLGGVTRDLLKDPAIPLIIAH